MVAAVLFFAWSALFAPSLQATIRYEVSLAHPERHLFHVTMHIPDVAGEVLVQMPAWNALDMVKVCQGREARTQGSLCIRVAVRRKPGGF